MIYLSGISLAILPDNDRISLLAELTVLAKQGVKLLLIVITVLHFGNHEKKHKKFIPHFYLSLI